MLFDLAMAGLQGAPTMNWADITGSGDAQNSNIVITEHLTITGNLNPNPGTLSIYYVLNDGAPVTYSGAFTVAPGDTLRWGAQAKGSSSGTAHILANGVEIDQFDITLT